MLNSSRTFSIILSFVLMLSDFNVSAAQATSKSPEYKAALKQMRVKKDEVKDITWYQDKSSPRYVNINGIYLYVGTSKGYQPSLRLAIQYAGEDWLFINRFYFKVDGKKFEIVPSYSEMKRDNDSKVWEWLDRSVKSGDLELVKTIAKSKKAVMRMEGDQYYKDVVISSAQKKAMQRVLAVYSGLLGGENN